MSASTTRPRITAVTAQLAAHLASGLAACDVLATELSRQARTALRAADLDATPASDVQPVVATREAAAARVAAAQPALSSLASIERVRATALVEAAAYRIEEATAHAALAAPLRALAAASTVAAAEAARTQFVATLEAEHQAALVGGLVRAVVQASAVAGFDAPTVHRSRPGGRVVVEALAPSGATLVTEIRPDAVAPSLATEVVGVHDGSCHAALDAFDAALAAAGVRSGPPDRRSTGGSCALAAARALLARRVGGPSTTAVAPTPEAPEPPRRRPTPSRIRARGR